MMIVAVGTQWLAETLPTAQRCGEIPTIQQYIICPYVSLDFAGPKQNKTN
jgi:hypothetical protein